MISATSGAQNSNAADILLSTSTPSVSSSSFTQQLTTALEQYLGQSSQGSSLEIDVQPSQSQNSGASQFLVTVKSSAPGTISSSPAPAVLSASAGLGPIFDNRGFGTSSVGTGVATTGVSSSPTPAADGGATLDPTQPSAGQPTTDPGTPDPGYEDVPFGTSFTAMPTLATELAESNRVNAMMAQINPDSLSTTMAQAGDPMAGASIPGSSLGWNDLTENQQLAYQHVALTGLPQGQSMDQFLAANVGPSAWWNASYNNPNMFGAPPAAGSVNMHTSPYVNVNG